MKRFAIVSSVLLFVVVCFGLASAQASVQMTADLSDYIFDEQVPRGVVGDAPVGWGDSSWQGPAVGKSNFHVRKDYPSDGNYWNYLFGDADVKVHQLAELSYWTKKGSLVPVDQDWLMTIYTFTTGTDDASSWYHSRLHSNFSTHPSDGAWHQWSTDNDSLLFQASTGSGDYLSLYNLGFSDRRDELVMSITLQTFSNWGGFDGYLDGLTIGVAQSEVQYGTVDFAVPEPATIIVWLLLGAGSWMGMRVWRRRRGGPVGRQPWSNENRTAIHDVIARSARS